MRGRWLALCVFATVLVAPADVPAATSPHETLVYLFAGQSNMVGASARTAELSAIAPELRRPPRNVLFFGPTADGPLRWGPLGPATETTQTFYGPGFGPELSAAHRLSRVHPTARIAIVKYARNGTSLHTDWDPDRRTSLYHALIDRTNSARSQLPTRSRIAGVFWMQGEWDADTRAHALAYRANLSRLIARIRADLDAPGVPFVIGRIRDVRTVSSRRPFSDIVRRAQLEVAASEARTFLVPTDGLAIDERSPLHFDTRGTIELGERFVQPRFGL